MDTLFNIQIDNKRNKEKSRINYKKSPKERITPSYLETRLETLEQQWAVFIETHREIVEKTDRKHNYFTSEAYELTEENINYKSELKEALRQFSSAKVIQDKQSTTGKCTTVKLPKIVIPIFSGK